MSISYISIVLYSIRVWAFSSLQGMALLHWAADRGALESIVALLDAGAELNLQVFVLIFLHNCENSTVPLSTGVFLTRNSTHFQNTRVLCVAGPGGPDGVALRCVVVQFSLVLFIYASVSISLLTDC